MFQSVFLEDINRRSSKTCAVAGSGIQSEPRYLEQACTHIASFTNGCFGIFFFSSLNLGLCCKMKFQVVVVVGNLIDLADLSTTTVFGQNRMF